MTPKVNIDMIGVYSGKGGVGKTITTATLAHAAALKGKKTIAVDLDWQGHISTSYGLDKGEGVYEWLVRGKPLAKCLKPTGRNNLEALQGNATTELIDRHFASIATLEIEARGIEKKTSVLALEMMQEKLNEFFDLSLTPDVIFFDCPPRRSLLVEAVLGMCDTIIIPTSMTVKDLEGAETAYAAIRKINPSARIILSPNRLKILDMKETFDSKRLGEITPEWVERGVTVADPVKVSEMIKPIEESKRTVWEWQGKMTPTLANVQRRYCELYDMLFPKE